MSKPTTLPLWCTTGLKTEPSLGYKQAGFVGGAQFLGDYVNWDLHNIYTWVQFLDNINLETEFLNKTFAYTAAHSHSALSAFNGGLTSTTISTTGNCTFGDTTGDSVAVTGTLTANVATVQQTITSTTGNLYAPAGDLVAGGDCRVTGDFEYNSARARLMFVPLGSFVDCNGTATRRWITAVKENAVDGSDNYNLNVVSPNGYDCAAEIRLPKGAVLTGVTASAHQSAAGATVNMTMRVLRSVYAVSGAPSVTVLGTDTHDGTTDDTLAVTGLSTTIDTDAEEYLVRFTSSDAGGADTDTVYYVLVAYTELGPGR